MNERSENMTCEEFCDKFHIRLNGQQLTAVRSVNGAILLLAVPGSGKTTVLVTSLGGGLNFGQSIEFVPR